MRRLLLIPLALVAVNALVWAADAPANREAAERARRLQRNRPLVEELVEGGLRLAGEKDALRRADRCNDLARHLADEIGTAADHNEGARAAELGQHLNDLLEQGVAGNLSEARSHIPAGSSEEEQLRDVHDRAAGLLGPLEQQLQNVADPRTRDDLRHTLGAVQAARAHIGKAIQGSGKPWDTGKRP
jgi:hypothetical protein